jgi:hypothetical protein
MVIMHETFVNEGLRGFFKGMLSPLMGALPYNSL